VKNKNGYKPNKSKIGPSVIDRSPDIISPETRRQFERQSNGGKYYQGFTEQASFQGEDLAVHD
jgi:hypothetical protein